MNCRNVLATFWLAVIVFGLGPASGYAAGQWKSATTLKSLNLDFNGEELAAVIEADGVMEHRILSGRGPASNRSGHHEREKSTQRAETEEISCAARAC